MRISSQGHDQRPDDAGDLAGSERLKTTGAMDSAYARTAYQQEPEQSGRRYRTLGSGQKHVPYRNSKLTFLLQDSLRERARCSCS